MKAPSKTKDWVREVEFALEEAISIQQSTAGKLTEISNVHLFKMAPGIAAIYRGIKSERDKQGMIDVSWSAAFYVHEHIPYYKNKYRRCFAHAYLDSIIYLQLLSRRKAEKIIDRLEKKGVIEVWQAKTTYPT